MTDLQIRPEPFGAPESAALLEEQSRELEDRYSGDYEPGPKPGEHDVTAFLVVRDSEGRPVGCGALRALGGGDVEIKRMYVRPHARGAGVGRRLLEALEAEALSQGFTRCRLETGDLQPEAMALYRHAGYGEIERYGPYACSSLSRCFERRLEG